MRLAIQKFVPVICLAMVLGGAAVVQSVTAQPGQPGSQPRQPGGPGGPPGGPGGRAPSVSGGMRSMNRAFHELETTIGDASKRDQNLMAVWTMQQGIATAKRAKPPHEVEDVANGVEDFRHATYKLTVLLTELEGQVLDNKTEDAGATLKKILALHDESHKHFNIKEEEQEGGEGPPPRGQ